MKQEDIRKTDKLNKYLELSAKDVGFYFQDKKEFQKTNCPSCNSKNFSFEFEKNSFKLHTCNECDTLFVSPRPSISQLNKFYSDSPSTTYWVNEFFLPVMDVRREKMFKPRAQFIADFLKNKNYPTLGDVGSGFGLFLEELSKIKSDINTVAIEPSVEMIKILLEKKIKVIPKLVEDINDHENYFDVLTSFELFEHLQNPANFLININKLLKSGGHFVFTTLNGLGFDIQILWKKSKAVSPPHHLNFANPKSIEILLKKYGFIVEDISTPGLLDWDIIESGYKNENIYPGRLFKNICKHGTDEAKKNFQEWISNNNFSSHMRVIAKKI